MQRKEIFLLLCHRGFEARNDHWDCTANLLHENTNCGAKGPV